MQLHCVPAYWLFLATINLLYLILHNTWTQTGSAWHPLSASQSVGPPTRLVECIHNMCLNLNKVAWLNTPSRNPCHGTNFQVKRNGSVGTFYKVTKWPSPAPPPSRGRARQGKYPLLAISMYCSNCPTPSRVDKAVLYPCKSARQKVLPALLLFCHVMEALHFLLSFTSQHCCSVANFPGSPSVRVPQQT